MAVRNHYRAVGGIFLRAGWTCRGQPGLNAGYTSCRETEIMSYSEKIPPSRLPNLTMAVWSAVLRLGGILPLLLYMEFGPADGNPIGLGLLSVVAVPVAGIGLAIAVIKMLVQHFVHREE